LILLIVDAELPMIVLTLKEQPTVPLEAEILSPDNMVALDNAAIRALPVFLGKRQLRVDDFFEVEGEASDELEIRGDARRVKWIGRAMSRGRINIVGNVGTHLGAYMKGGTIDVSGNAGDWVGGEMKNGTIRIAGNAGGQVGAAYRGSMQGMQNGLIVVGGTAGLEVGMRMRRGLIVIKGLVRDFCGLQMKGGTIVMCSGAEIRAGAWMIRGTLISLKPLKLLPTFLSSGTGNPSFVRLYAKHLKAELGLDLPYQPSEGAYETFRGDSSVPGKGEILVWRPHAS
jgi:formylmethanofuran dehydrogenase subunit C